MPHLKPRSAMHATLLPRSAPPQAHQAALGVADVQLRLTPLEEVFLTVARKVGPAMGKPAGRSAPACARWCS